MSNTTQHNTTQHNTTQHKNSINKVLNPERLRYITYEESALNNFDADFLLSKKAKILTMSKK